MDIIYNIIVALICLIFGYLIGSVSFSILIGKIFYHQDPREYGSKNAGGTNAGRLWGKKMGLLVITLDMIKTVIPMWICWAILTFVPFGDKPLLASTAQYYSGEGATYLINWPVYLLANLGSVIGHCWPIFYKFKGGKGVSAFMGTILGASWGLGWVPGLLWYFPVLKKTKYVSFTSMTMTVVASIFAWIWTILCMTNVIQGSWCYFPFYGPTINCSWHYALIITLMSILIIYQHRGNIQRLRAGTERRIKWMDSKKDKEKAAQAQ